MDEKEIVKMLWNREENGLKALQENYSSQLKRLAKNFVSEEDAKECFNDTLLSIWNSIPPNKPEHLFAYSAKICRNKALNMIRRSQSRKRKAEIVELSNELQNVIPERVEEEKENVLTELINDFLTREKSDDRYIFVHRYWFGESIVELSKVTGYGESKIKSKLFRMRNRLRKYLEGRYRI